MRITAIQVTAVLPAQPTFIELVQEIYLQRYTGPYTVHTLHGNPQMVEFHDGTKVLLDTRRALAA